MAGTVTLDKGYFETLLRRAQFHTSGTDFTTPIDVATVTIPKSDHDGLLASSREYANLRRNLYRGGIAEETLNILIQNDNPANENGASATDWAAEDGSDSGVLLTQIPTTTIKKTARGQDYTYGRNDNYTHQIPRNGNSLPQETNGYHKHSPPVHDEYTYTPDGPDEFDDEGGLNDTPPRPRRPQYEKSCNRTIVIGNLPEGATHADVVAVIKGGMLLDIYLRPHDRAARVSFLHESSAQDFFRHSKRHDLYIKGKRVEVRWCERHFILPGHVANKIAIGATRNLVIVNRTAKHTEEAIRDDLEHIHNLVIIKVTFIGKNAHISTNSVHNAMFSRTCMMSRAVYKGSKIEWDVDECDVPLEKPPQVRSVNMPVKKKDLVPTNRFHLLNVDGTDDESQEEDLDTSGASLPTSILPSIPSQVF